MSDRDIYDRPLRFNPYHAKVPVKGRLVVVLDGQLTDRGLSLIQQPSRALKAGEIHELIVTTEAAGPGQCVEEIAYVAFAEITSGGVALVGDEVIVEGDTLGHLAGFDETHSPNHLNVVVRSASLRSGAEMGLKLGGEVVIRPGNASLN
ncbi:MAG: hypothetical protein AB1497_12090 [Bacillota bacterium]